MKASTIKMTFSQKESLCENTFMANGPFWHLCTPGQLTEIICETDADYAMCCSIIGIAAAVCGVRVIAFEVMSNHIHVVLAGPESSCNAFFKYFKEKLQRYYSQSGRFKNWDAFTHQLIPITSLEMMRTEVVYVNRNGYVVFDLYTPFSYPWGSSNLYFNPMVELVPSTDFNSLTYREKRVVCGGRILELPASYKVTGPYLMPSSFCSYKLGEAMFRDAHQYFAAISKNVESYSEIAKRLGDTVFLTDDEMFSTLQHICKKEFNDPRPTMLPNEARIELAKRMKREYNASAGQIQRMLRLSPAVIAELFGR